MEKIERTTMTNFEMMTMKIETTTTKVRGHDGKDWTTIEAMRTEIET